MRQGISMRQGAQNPARSRPILPSRSFYMARTTARTVARTVYNERRTARDTLRGPTHS